MKRLLAVLFLLASPALAQIGRGPISGGGGGAGVTGLTSCADGTAIADNAIIRGDGTTKCQGSPVTVADTTGAISGASSITGGTSGTSTLTLDGDSTVAGEVTVSAAGVVTIPETTSGTYGLTFTGLPTVGVQSYNSGNLALAAAAGKYIVFLSDTTGLALFDVTGFVMLSSGQYKWDTFGGIGDTGLARASAGVVKVTNGNTGIRGFLGGGAAVASATALPVPTGNLFHVTGTTTITSLTATNLQSGVCFTMIFDDVLTLTDGGNIKIAGDFVTTADDTIRLCFDGTNFYESGARSIN